MDCFVRVALQGSTGRRLLSPASSGIIALAMARFGIEEEVFITEPERPNLRSLYYLAKLLAKNPRFYYTHSAHNFTRGKDVVNGLMSGVEISTAIYSDPDAVVDDLARRRADLAQVASGLIVPVGHLLDIDAPSNTCAIHVHIDGVPDKRRLYRNILHFLPVLCLFTANSPMVAGSYFGKSYRMHASYAIGPIKSDWTIRFQDVIFSKRLKTIELRVCDPCWDLTRVRYLLRAVAAIAELDDTLEPNTELYNALRERICREGLLDETAHLADELRSIVDFPMELITRTASDELHEVYESCGLVGAYSALDNGYRNGVFEPREVSIKKTLHFATAAVGFAGYFIPRLPFYAVKGLLEM
ncbi:MAG: glutamate-cysteine ligase family protein [Armatimonadota bacterium]|nr:glutamate-cysteine ligase family protein [Armatimonadota bacterium]